MRALVVYESMYGNTHAIAGAVAAALTERGFEAVALPVGEATIERIADVDLLVVGGPTHAHGMTRETTRKGAVADAHKPGSELHLDPDAEGEGLREWFDALPRPAAGVPAAAFDTRVHLSPALTGRAGKGISKRLRRHGYTEIAEPESFFVTKDNTLEPSEEQRARNWAHALATAVENAAEP